ncbi:PTS sugar transporter subunit IIA [Companilactobacillus insicii]|uniref:PTS sugar transporter subunit IIA n=1 Tax=Companilactobacillus insicii TaxID=1732567 RepID=UPI000F7A33BC|nr:PTS sugar transporter subunit IIA [Companilactobacillus insicii]
MKIVVTGHGNFASGIHSTVKLLAGQLPGVSFIDFTGDMNEKSLSEEFTNEIKNDDSVVFFCDLLGGTPFKEAVKLSMSSDKDIQVTCGCNVGSLMEIGLQLSSFDGNATDLANKLVETSKSQTQLFVHKENKFEADAEDDGI